ncbi:MAG: hypothetical protein COA79_03930 [Planctomycetota bacterium]|nr:MAG: hypothetical protein COA79_03930 [Planctomycetota bacterium]
MTEENGFQNNLSPSDELSLLKKIYGESEISSIYQYMMNCFNIIQTRSQIVLSLATICLTITGFSGAKIANSSVFSMGCLVIGLSLVLLSIITVLSGPLQVRWISQIYHFDLDTTIEELIKMRNKKTRLYQFSILTLGIGLSFYVLSVISFLIHGNS